jgi:flagellar protein FliL
MPDMPSSFASMANPAEVSAGRALRDSSRAASGEPISRSSVTSKTSAAKSNAWIYIFVAAALGGGIFFWPHLATIGTRGAGEVVEKSALPLETFVVNLGGGGQRAYLRLGVTLGLARALSRNREETAVPLVRDAILSVLANAKADELLTTQGKEQLKADLLRSITQRAPELGVESVFFTEFLVQM